MPERLVAVAAAALFTTAAVLAGGPALAESPKVAMRITEAPDAFTAGQQARGLTAVVATDRGGQCRRVRWVLLIRTQGVSLDQIRVNRVENGQPFGVRAQVDADTAQIVDADFDPGQLCRNRTVTAHWNIGFTGPDAGRADFQVGALDERGRLLATAALSRGVVTGAAAPTAAPPTAEPTEAAPPPSAEATPTDDATPTDEASPTDTAGAANGLPSTTDPVAQTPAAASRSTGGQSVLLPGLMVGAVLVFVGVALLMRLRMRNRQAAQLADMPMDTAMPPTGFYDMPAR